MYLEQDEALKSFLMMDANMQTIMLYSRIAGKGASEDRC